MRRCRLSLLLAVAIGLITAAAGQAPTLPSGQMSVFSGDTRLEKPIAAAVRDRPLADVLAAVGRAAGVRLRVGRAAADDRATLCVTRRPAGEVLLELARHFDFRWRRVGQGYELNQDERALRREAANRDGDLRAQLRGIEAQMRAASDAYREQTARRAGELARTFAEPVDPADRARRVAEWGRLGRESTAPVALVVYRSLAPAQLRQLQDMGALFLSSRDGSLVPALAARVDRLADDLAGEPLVQPPLQTYVDLRLDEGGVALTKPPTDPAPRLSLRIHVSSMRWLTPVPAGEPDTRPTFGPDRPPAMVAMYQWSAEAPRPEPPGPRAGDDAFLKREVTLSFAARTEKARDDAAPQGVIAGGGEWPAEWVTLGEVAEALHETAGVDVLSDSFVRARLAPEKLAGKHTLGAVLDTIAKELHYDWARDGDRVRLRSRTAHWDRAKEVPERILGPWRERIAGRAAAPGQPTLEDLGLLAAALTDRQCRSLQEYWGWYLQNTRTPIPPPSPGGFYGLRQHFRLWGALSPAQRGQALSPAGLPVRLLSPAQRNLFLTGMASVRYEEYIPLDRRRVVTLEGAAGGSLRVSVERLFEQAFLGEPPTGDPFWRSSRFGDLKDPKPLERDEFDDPEGFARITWKPVGAPFGLSAYRFQYLLAGEEKPARAVAIDVLSPRRRA